MNLYDILRRKDRAVSFEGDVQMAHRDINEELWRGLHISAGSSFLIAKPLQYFSLRSWPDTCGWFASLPANGPDLEVSFYRHGTEDVLTRSVLPAGMPGTVAVRLPWPADGAGDFDLVLRAVSSGRNCSAAIFLANHRALSRSRFLEMAKGVGVEIGPGPQPQIMPASDVSIHYLEQMPPEKWSALYNKGGKYPERPELWSNYLVGDASSIPCEDNSLDFIFGSHVFEHLANPIGHLERWSKKLKVGGRVLCVIPDLAGTKDSIQELSTLAEWQREFDQEIWDPTVQHYVRHMRRDETDPRLLRAISDRESIHVHYYTNINCEQLLSYACENLEFSHFSLTWTPNHKDFYFNLVK